MRDGTKGRRLYWAVPILLFLLQLVFTWHSLPQLRYEELAESVRNVYWLEHRTIYDGTSSNVGWYGLLLVSYRLFGFSLYAAKYVRLFLSAVSLLALAAILRRYFRPERAWLPLLVIGMSPTLLYFNTLQAQYGIDLQYAPIVLYLVLSLRFSSGWIAAAQQVLLGLVAMIGAMSYPTFVFNLPVLGAIYVYRVRDEKISRQHARVGMLMIAVGFLLPLAVALFALKDPRLLVFDPRLHTGIFRGAGLPSPRPGNFARNLIHSAVDFFGHANSYYFEVARTEFSDVLPALAVGVILVASLALARSAGGNRRPFTLAWALLVITLIGTGLAVDPTGSPGMRRVTPVLAAVYALCALSWYRVVSTTVARTMRVLVTASLLVILLHHVAALPLNYAHQSAASDERYGRFFDAAATPEQSLAQFVGKATRGDLKLKCEKDPDDCRYPETYAAVAGSCLWNHLTCHELYGFDDRTHQFIPLRIALWENYYWDH